MQDKTSIYRMDVYGVLQEHYVEPWLAKVLSNDVFAAAMADHDWDSIESYGGRNESIAVWRHRKLGWIVDWWDTDSRVMLVVIDDKRAYLGFQANWVAPMAVKIMQADAMLATEDEQVGLDQADRDDVVRCLASSPRPTGTV